MNSIDALLALLLSPIAPPLLLAVGSAAVWLVGRRAQKPGPASTLALAFWAAAVGLTVLLSLQPVVPVFSRPWQPFLSSGANLLWISDGWNWYISCLVLLLGGVALLLSGYGGHFLGRPRRTTALAGHLNVIAAALLFVGSGNLLTVTLMWVVMDFFIIARNASAPLGRSSQGLSLLGALLLLIALLPAGQNGPAQALAGGNLPQETVVLMLLAAAIRAGGYPFHLWLLPHRAERLRLPDRFVDHMIPALCGLWMLGLASGLAGHQTLVRPVFVAVALLALLGTAIAAYTATARPGHTTFVLITSVGVAGLTSILSETSGPAAVIWPTTTFALGGGLWLVGERIWREWGWQVPVSVGALALVGVPFTPGFLTQSAVARLLTGEFSGALVLPFFAIYLIAQTVYVSALLRSWGVAGRVDPGPEPSVSGRLLACGVALAIPLVIAGVFPQVIAAVTYLPQAIPRNAGDPATAVAGWHVWLTVAAPLLLGMGLAVLRPRVWPAFGQWPDRVSRVAALDWFPGITDWGTSRVSRVWDLSLEVVEGAGYVGWLVAFGAIGYFLLNV